MISGNVSFFFGANRLKNDTRFLTQWGDVSMDAPFVGLAAKRLIMTGMLTIRWESHLLSFCPGMVFSAFPFATSEGVRTAETDAPVSDVLWSSSEGAPVRILGSWLVFVRLRICYSRIPRQTLYDEDFWKLERT